MHWTNDSRYPPIANIISRNRHQKLREFLQVDENSQEDNLENAGNKLYKI